MAKPRSDVARSQAEAIATLGLEVVAVLAHWMLCGVRLAGVSSSRGIGFSFDRATQAALWVALARSRS